jgi:hypothetical protein
MISIRYHFSNVNESSDSGARFYEAVLPMRWLKVHMVFVKRSQNLLTSLSCLSFCPILWSFSSSRWSLPFFSSSRCSWNLLVLCSGQCSCIWSLGLSLKILTGCWTVILLQVSYVAAAQRGKTQWSLRPDLHLHGFYTKGVEDVASSAWHPTW